MRSASAILFLLIGPACFMSSYNQTVHEESHHHGNSNQGNNDEGQVPPNGCSQKYSEQCNKQFQGVAENEESEMFRKGHLKPFGSHRAPDAMVEELKYMISPQDFYMNYVVKHKPVVFKGIDSYILGT
jgi:hypothetical protein